MAGLDERAVRQAVQAKKEETLNRLKEYLRLPSVSAQHRAIPETVGFLAKEITDLGGHVRVLDDFGGNPVIYAHFAAGETGDPTKTLLFYNHYDVQPPEPLDEWETGPFDPTIKNGVLFARGTADNKGALVQRLAAVRVLQALEGGLPCEVTFLIEGEEEIGSPHLERCLRDDHDLFQADACIWEFGSKDEKDRVLLDAGIKGMAYFELTCTGADIDMHSSVGAYIDNAAWRLVQALASMKNADNEILVDGFYDGITEPTENEKALVRRLPFDEKAVARLYGLKRPLIAADPRKALIFQPTMTICGIESGYTGEGAKTVLPKNAKAKLDCRLVPGQDPDHIFESIKRHLLTHGFADVHVELINGQKAYRSDSTHPFVTLAAETAKAAYHSDVVLRPNSAGTGPMYIFGKWLTDLPIISTGVGWAESKVHAPNESIRLKDFEDGIVHMVYLLEGFSRALNGRK